MGQVLYERVVTDECNSAKVAAELVERSVWFSVTPLSDNHWLFAVKVEEMRELDAARPVTAGTQDFPSTRRVSGCQ